MELFAFLKNPIYLALLKIVLVILLAIAIYYLLKFLLIKQLRKFSRKTRTQLDDLIFEFFEKFLFRIIFITALYFVGEFLSVFSGEKFFFYFSQVLYAVVVIVITTLVVRIINLIITYYLNRISRRTGTEIEKDFGLLLQRVVQIVAYTIATITVLTHFNVDVKGLVATLGVGSLAIALAAQDTLSNMIAGFVIMVDRPFRVGDRIKTPNNVVGEVYEIGLRSMKLLDFEKNLHIIPNADIIKSEVINYSYPNPKVRVKVDVGVAYGSDLEEVKRIMIEVCQKHPKVLDDPPPNAYFVNFGDSSLDLTCISFVEHYKDAWTTADEIRMAIYKAFDEHNIEIPFPQHVVYLHRNSE